MSKVNLVVIVLFGIICKVRSLEELQICARSLTRINNQELERNIRNEKKSIDYLSTNILHTRIPRNIRNDVDNGTHVHNLLAKELTQFTLRKQFTLVSEGRDDELLEETARGRKKMDRILMSLLIAYKMKFMALIPTLIGSIILLFASNALAGFFFALFATVVSMKSR